MRVSGALQQAYAAVGEFGAPPPLSRLRRGACQASQQRPQPPAPLSHSMAGYE